MNPLRNTKLLALSSFTLALIALSTQAATTWDNNEGTGDFDIGNSDNWTNGLPDSGNLGTLDNGDTVLMKFRSDLTGRHITVSGDSTIKHDNTFTQFRWGDSVINLNSGGNLDVDYTASTQMGRDGVTTLNMFNGSTANFVAGLAVGREFKATVNQFGGTMVIGGTLSVPENSGGSFGSSIYHLSGGSVTASNLLVDSANTDTNYFNFTTGSTGTLTIFDQTTGDGTIADPFVTAAFDFESFIDDGEIRLNGNINSDFADFVVTTGSTGEDGWSRLALVPEPGTYTLFAGLFALSSIMVRRRERVV